MIVDSHCHLNSTSFNNQLDDVVLRALASNVAVMQTVCTKISEFQDILAIAEKNEGIYCSVGNHPNELEQEGIILANDLLKLAEHKKVIGIGETGLDYFEAGFDKKAQQRSFIEHIIASQASKLPVIVHTRSADEDTVAILKEMMSQQRFSGVIHCFASTRWLAEESLKLGLHISASGIITFKNATLLQEIFASLPDECILIETDAPFLSPAPFRGKTNEPSRIVHTAEFLALLRNTTYAEIAKLTTKNFFNLFTKAQPSFSSNSINSFPQKPV